MTREEAIDYLDNYRKLYAELAPERFLEALDVILSESQLPSNIDEAAEKNFETMEVLEHENIFEETHNKIFKAGAEWNDRQYHKIEGELVDWYSTSDGKDYCCGIRTEDSFEVPAGFYIKKKI